MARTGKDGLMSLEEPSDLGSSFPTTQWTALLNPIREHRPEAEAALEKLCHAYWGPLYEYARRRGIDHHAAEEVTQEFIVTLLRRDDLAKIRREHGRFRSFLMISLRNFLISRHERATAQKRGGGAELLPFDEEANAGPAEPEPADIEFDRRWAWLLIETALRQLEQEFVAADRREWYADLKGFLSDEHPPISRAALAAKHGTGVNAIDVAIHRLRKRYGEVLRELVTQTVTTPAEVNEELRYLASIIGR